MSERPTCATCLWWDYDPAANDPDGDRAGKCRRHAPAPRIVVETEDFDHYPTWPLTLAAEFCGDWQPPPAAPQRETP
jgi:hypothetical protein